MFGIAHEGGSQAQPPRKRFGAAARKSAACSAKRQMFPRAFFNKSEPKAAMLPQPKLSGTRLSASFFELPSLSRGNE
jgi:hypothetical protein